MEVFYPYNNNIPELDVEWGGTDPANADNAVVVFQDTEWTLTWVMQYSYYRGTIAGIEGYVL